MFGERKAPRYTRYESMHTYNCFVLFCKFVYVRTHARRETACSCTCMIYMLRRSDFLQKSKNKRNVNKREKKKQKSEVIIAYNYYAFPLAISPQ